tara:strand:+ start:142 stop:813 length:672 start_codon:yes stop_codon:yes gene_type:complete
MIEPKTQKITFIHTAPVLVDVFSALIEKYQLNISAQHHLHSELLKKAIANGMSDELASQITDVCLSHSQDSDFVVCTCSSLGEVAENITLANGRKVIRIDRAMADLAVNSGNNILVLAALESTLTPTASVLTSSQKTKNIHNKIDYQVVEDCWSFFLAGQADKYHQAIADVIELKQDDYDCIVLAQASMSEASVLVKNNRALILSSPEIGIQSLAEQLIKQAV